MLIHRVLAAMDLEPDDEGPDAAIRRNVGLNLIEVEVLRHLNEVLAHRAPHLKGERSRALRSALASSFRSNAWRRNCPRIDIEVPLEAKEAGRSAARKLAAEFSELGRQWPVRTLGDPEALITMATPAGRPRRVRLPGGLSSRPPSSRSTGVAVEGADRERRAVVVAGMHRSGTSVIARVISRLGLSLPKTPVGARPSNEFGHWGESERVRSLHDELLVAAGSSWDDVSPFPKRWLGSPSADDYRARMVATLREEYPASASFVIKDPRICRLVPFWLGVLDSLGVRPAFVLPLRNPLEVAASLERRDGFSSSKGLLLWLRHMLDAEHDTRGHPRVFVSYSEVLRDWRASAQVIAESAGLSWAGKDVHSTPEMDRYISADERHHKFATDQLSTRSDVVEWVTEAYLLLLDACGSNTAPDPARLDELGRAVADADLAYGPVLAESKRQTQELLERSKAAIESRDARLGSLEAERVKLVAKLETLSVLRGEVDQLTRESRRTHAAVRDLSQLFESLRTDVAALREAHDATLTRRIARSLRNKGRRAGRAVRSLMQLGSWILNPASAGKPRQAWEWLVLRRSGLLDAEFYLSRNLDVAAADMNPLMHYIEHGARAGLDPSPVFSTAAYVATHPELNDTGVNPLYHYRRSRNGASEHSAGDDEGPEPVRAARNDRSSQASPSATAGGPVGRGMR